jgi:hypothetical protein
MGKREPQIIPQKRRARHSPRARVRGEIHGQIKRLGRKPGFLEGDKLEVAVNNGRWVLRSSDDPAPCGW